MKAIEISISKYEMAVGKLSEGIDQAKNELDRDGVIQRFEFTFELFWKTLKLIIKFEGRARPILLPDTPLYPYCANIYQMIVS